MTPVVSGSTADWRAWLVIQNKHSGVPGVRYGEAIELGLMTGPGPAAIDLARATGTWDRRVRWATRFAAYARSSETSGTLHRGREALQWTPVHHARPELVPQGRLRFFGGGLFAGERKPGAGAA